MIAEPGADFLPLPENASRFQMSYASNQTLETTLHVSNWGAAAIAGATVSWEVSGTRGGATRVLCRQNRAVPPAPQGPNTTLIAAVRCQLPDLGTFTDDPKSPLTLRLNATLASAAGEILASNWWRSRLYAAFANGPTPPGVTLITNVGCDSLPISNMLCTLPAPGTKLPNGTVVVVDYLDDSIVDFATTPGVTVIAMLAKASAKKSANWIETEPTYWPTAWWVGTKTNNNAVSVVYDGFDAIAPDMAPEGWADECWFRIFSEGQNFLLDALPPNSVDVLIRSVDSIWAGSRSKAVMWQAGVVSADDPTAAGGTLLVSGLNLVDNVLPDAAKTASGCEGFACTLPEA